ncbi:phospholipid-translocating P-type ATPase [Sodiomyces alkalinus F11]|uniref:Phospholipid-transporting ATPase n=1 Tax=Sodiomyces alkalinus (strain CBS 110278 / VKM F-3762 / F11) TaxID=1314773 RepID=A0A3N2PWS9_SODAK|nr:phospholipid-translocating P-type ATPase [Sodiomyces alkalinus F11]ROT38983.1 phospholipid-translocating P-type ATPase [Sodiomyces alkalinus F11]
MTRPPPRNPTTAPTDDEHSPVPVAHSGARPAYPFHHIGSSSKAHRESQNTVPDPISYATTVDFDDLKAESSTQYKAPKKSKRIRWLDARDEAFGRVATLYRKVVIQGILRQKPLPPSPDGRHIPLSANRKRSELLTDERTRKPYTDNFIRSSRYTVWDFLPKQLIFQFSKLGNAYFLAISIMQLTPGLSTTGEWTTFAPLMAFVALSMAKEGYDDYRRYRLDKADNRSEVQVLGEDLNALRRAKKKVAKATKEGSEMAMDDLGDGGHEGEWSTILWQDVKVGDIVRLRRDENVPADIVVLHASNPNSVTYIETMALDGETNLKAKRASPALAAQCSTLAGLKACEAVVVSEDPNVDLYRYDGRVTVGEETLPLSLANVVYRGSTVRNTAETIGLVVNTGEECKIRMNAHKHVTTKAPAMQYVVNGCIVWLVFVLLGISGGLTGGYFLLRNTVERHSWFLGGTSLSFREVFIAYIIMFNTLIPLSLYISLEIIKVIQFYLMGDVEMYDPVTNTPMVANTTTILEDLGQVNYVFSDKTGTLTENVMRFRKMSVAGTAWLHDMDVERDEEAKQKLIAMARKKRKGKGKDKDKDKNRVAKPELDDPPHVSSPARWNAGGNQNGTAERDPELKTEDLLDYLRRRPNTAFARKAKFFLLSIALCHTCLPEEGDKGEIEYQAASPDEHALVEAARDLGYVLVDRPNQQIILQLPNSDGSTTRETYEVLDVIDFTSKRKRMSIIIRMPDGRICVFCKGADSIILPRLKLSHIAMQKASGVEAMAHKRRSIEQEKQRISMSSPRNSMAMGRPSISKRHSQFGMKDADDAQGRLEEVEVRKESERHLAAPSPLQSPRTSYAASPRPSMALSVHEDVLDGLVDESAAMNDGAMFERCFQHIDEFARDGLRTLLYGYRYLEEDEYARWRKIYSDASTSLENRQAKMEAAGELIEEKFDLAGATAIEDKLQEGVPDTIDKLRRAGIKVWMLTGDKRETAINIAHSARLCQPFSEVIILDSTTGRLEESIHSTLSDVSRGILPHTVVVVDGHTLGLIDDDETLSCPFYDLASRVDSVICCRASPAQKANLVKRIRRQVRDSLTLAIGDGANDIGMIQASHVGVGISGREGLQAARISDYSIAQFRFLQRLLFVHGRYNYLRTGKYILATFWKEIVFFLPQAHFQRFNAYSGTSLYENWSLTVFNTFFTSLPVIFLGGFEKDLSAKTLLEHPELYRYGHDRGAINVRLYVGWTLLGVAESFIIYYLTWGVYNKLPFDEDTSLYAMGTVPFNVCVIFINVKLLVLEMHDKTIIAFLGVFLSITGWFLWNLALSGLFQNELRIYQIRRAFLDNFGATLNFWTVCLVALGAVLVLELFVDAVRRVYWANDVDLMQRIEREERKAAKRKAKEKMAGSGDPHGEDRDGHDGMQADTVVYGMKPHGGTVPTTAGRAMANTNNDVASARTSLQRLRRSSDFPAAVPEDGSDPFEKGFGKAHKTKMHQKPPHVTTRWVSSGRDVMEESPIELNTPTGDSRVGQAI